MNETEFTFQTKDGVSIFSRKWLPEGEVRGILQIAHGMAEHSARYADFAHFMNKNGFAVYADDHRGHGKTAGTVKKMGYFADKNGWEKVLGDIHQLSGIAKKEYPDVPFFLLGHSMGSFFSRNYIQLFGNEVDGVILSGTAAHPGILGNIGIGIAKSLGAVFGKKNPSVFMNQLSFGTFNKPFKPNRTLFDWLSRDPQVADQYIADPYCGAIFSFGFFADMLHGILLINQPENIKKIPKNLPIYIFSGDKDPVGEFGKGVKRVHKAFKDADIQDVTIKLYKDGRHEMLNEINRAEVYADVLGWVNGRL